MMLSMAPANRLTGKGESGSTILANGMTISPNSGPFTPSSTVFWGQIRPFRHHRQGHFLTKHLSPQPKRPICHGQHAVTVVKPLDFRVISGKIREISGNDPAVQRISGGEKPSRACNGKCNFPVVYRWPNGNDTKGRRQLNRQVQLVLQGPEIGDPSPFPGENPRNSAPFRR